MEEWGREAASDAARDGWSDAASDAVARPPPPESVPGAAPPRLTAAAIRRRIGEHLSADASAGLAGRCRGGPSGNILDALARIRDEADRARCPSLLLYEEAPFELGSTDPAIRAAASDRIGRLARAASMLGCANLGISCSGADKGDCFDLAAASLRRRASGRCSIPPRPRRGGAPRQGAIGGDAGLTIRG